MTTFPLSILTVDTRYAIRLFTKVETPSNHLVDSLLPQCILTSKQSAAGAVKEHSPMKPGLAILTRLCWLEIDDLRAAFSS